MYFAEISIKVHQMHLKSVGEKIEKNLLWDKVRHFNKMLKF